MKTPKIPRDHDFCECGRWKPRLARTCWRCEDKDDAIFPDLERRVRQDRGYQQIPTAKGALKVDRLKAVVSDLEI